MIDLDKILDKIESEHPYKVPGDSNSYSQYNEGWCDCVDRVRKELKDVEKNDMREHELTKIVNEICQNTFFMNDDNIVKDKDRDENELYISFSKLKEIISKYVFCKNNPDDWIPVEERLPEKFSIGVEVTTKDLERNIARYAKPPMDMWISVYTGRTLDVIAWKEPSESYHPEGLETRKNSKGARKNERD